MGWMIRVVGFDSWRGLGIFLFTIVSRMALGPAQSPIQRIPGAWVYIATCIVDGFKIHKLPLPLNKKEFLVNQ